MTELRAKRVTHAQSPYITVEACKLFNPSPPSAHPVLAREHLFSISLSLSFSLLLIFLPSFLPFQLSFRVPGAGPQIIEAQLERRKKTVTGLNASTSPWFFLSSLASLSISFSPFLPLVLLFSSFVSRPSPSLSTIPLAILVLFFETLLHLLSTPSSRGALLVPGLCRGLGGKRVGLAIIPKEARQTFRIEQLFEISVRYPSRHRKLYLTAISPCPPILPLRTSRFPCFLYARRFAKRIPFFGEF